MKELNHNYECSNKSASYLVECPLLIWVMYRSSLHFDVFSKQHEAPKGVEKGVNTVGSAQNTSELITKMANYCNLMGEGEQT